MGNVEQWGLKRSVSDHVSVLFSKGVADWGIMPFRFIDAYLKKPDCRKLVCEFFNVNVGNNMDISSRLRKLKGALKRWNVDLCNNFDDKVEDLQNKINALEEEGNRVELGPRKQADLQAFKLELWESLKLQEDLWRQKSRVKWLALGDSNTTFFTNRCKRRGWRSVFNMKFKMISESDARMSKEPFSLIEIKETVWACDGSRAPRPNGFNLHFFKECWGL
ncbi:uncharacterized protein LOC120198157 [Hibiscus syriacus]|uniref:uncharacterized protein LOC120198157 n=1 Tax=Hibiscus syriacus TaxID=106335 RepID=UPI001922C754|nr:uncharacterized protein LOC120198157 [Hibiscus syriacus]